MAVAERGLSLYKRTIGSEGFERFSRKPIGIITAVLLTSLGLGSVQGIIDAIDQEEAKVAASYGVQASFELGTAGAIAFANIRSRIRPRQSEASLSPQQQDQQATES